MNALRICVLALGTLLAGEVAAQSSPLDALEGREFPQGATRLALVVWSETYKYLKPVENAGSDGRRIAQELHKLSFDFVRELSDVTDAGAILDGANELKAQIAASSRPVVVVFFFAGHGFQVDGDNYIVPRLASNESTAALVDGSVSLTEISRRLSPIRRAGLTLLMLDACRTIRFMEDGSLKDVPLVDGLEPGFSEGNPLAPAIVSMAALPGKAARSVSRLEGKNSPYTTAVAPRLGTPGLSLAKLIDGAQRQVWQDTNEGQLPSLFNFPASSTFFFKPTASELTADELAWKVVLSRPENVRGCAQDYLLTYPTGQFATRAEYLLSLAAPSGGYCSVN